MREDPRVTEPASHAAEPADRAAAPGEQRRPVRLDRRDRLDWREFGERYWDRQPALFTSVTPAPFDVHEVFETAVAAAHRGGPFGVPPYAGFAVGGEPQTDPGDFLPQPRDGSFAGYHQRLVRQLSGEPYSLALQAFHAFHHPLWARERAFFSGLWARVGQPAQSAFTTLVHGTYEQPLAEALPGQRVATFLFVLGGRQRMRFGAADRSASYAVEAGPGDLLYWPSHLSPAAEPYAGWASTGVRVSVVREGRQAAAELYDLLYDVTPETLLTPDPDPAGAAPPGEEGLLVPDAEAGPELPAPLERALAHFRSAGARGPLEERVARQSLRHWTAGGFRPVPPPAPRGRFGDDDVVRATERVLWTEAAGRRLYSACGHVAATELPAADLAAVLRVLNSGRPLPVRELAPAARVLLAELTAFRALERL
ncbi:hypothetical protein OHB53_07100 [Streptomyces sp. NBC_00056]|uniref:hypothetical protein n=1 Tax=unclassified Streptomyces TaxID=2593676 RepID=UPI002E8123E1|nr:hypothetical protein [Streptomyces sp. NBC_00569]WUB92108.1 hypothetical protein OHO83_07070 [Streptomyces sp. NBC_00569]